VLKLFPHFRSYTVPERGPLNEHAMTESIEHQLKRPSSHGDSRPWKPRASPAHVCHPKTLRCPVSPLSPSPLGEGCRCQYQCPDNPHRLSIFGLPTLCVSPLLCNQGGLVYRGALEPRGSRLKRVCSIAYVQYTSQGMKVLVHASSLPVEEPNNIF
jgi:hypothetical protein